MQLAGFQRTSFSDFPGKVAAVVYTRGCNFRCRYCHNPTLVEDSTGSDQTVTVPQVMAFLRRRRGQVQGLVVTGGEPTLQPDLPEFLIQVQSLGLTVKLDTNGSRPNVLRRLLRQRLVDYVAMDVKAPLSKYRSVANCSVNPKRVAESIDLLLASSVEHEFRTTVVWSLLSPDDLLAIGDMLRGARQYVLQPFVANETLDRSFAEETPSQSAAALTAMSAQIASEGIRCRVR